MRLIGNKTKLLPAIQDFLERRGVHGGTFLDVFAGTASVGRHFRALGYRVRTNDLLASSYLRQRAYIALDRVPDLSGVTAQPRVARWLRSKAGRAATAAAAAHLGAALRDGSGRANSGRANSGRANSGRANSGAGAAGLELAGVCAYLSAGAKPARGLFARQYSEDGAAGRLFFSRGNGERIDGVHAQLQAWRRRGALDEDGFCLLLTALLEAADRVANISGTYGAFLKRLQPSAAEPLQLRPPELDLSSPGGRAYREDANKLVRRLSVDVLYLDPPYNNRQYAKNYHVPEVLAELHTVSDLPAYEAGIYGKTGLRRFEDRASAYCKRSRRGAVSPCARAFADLVAAAKAEHVVVSYSEEGILSREEIGAALADAAGQAGYDFAAGHEEVRHKRFRSDRERRGRSYKVLDGRARDEVAEWLFYVRKPRTANRRAG